MAKYYFLLQIFNPYDIIGLRHNSIIELYRWACIFISVKMHALYLLAHLYSSKEVRVVSQQLELCVFRCVASAAHFLLPDLPKPNIPKRKLVKTDNYLRETLRNMWYSNYIISKIEPEDFENRIKALLASGIIIAKSDNSDYSSTIDFLLSSKTVHTVSINPKINTNINVTVQIGGININKN